jgi:ElaB/YqjD/DUF883 family membrane-anchored ribosome-binding protein
MAQASKSETSAGKSNVAAADIEEQIKTIRDDVANLSKLIMQLGEDKVSEAVKTARDEAEELLNRSRRMADEATDRAKKTAGSVEDYIAEKPIQSAMIALLVGFLIGSMSRR